MARKLVVVENELERSEKRIDDLTFENSKLKDEIRTYSNELKSFEAADEQYSERETQVTQKMISTKIYGLFLSLNTNHIFSWNTHLSTSIPT